MLGYAFEHIPQVGFWILAVELGSTDKGVDAGGALTTRVCSGEEMIFASQGNAPESLLCGVVVQLCTPIVAVPAEGLPARERVADGAGGIGLLRQLARRTDQPGP